MKTTMTTSRTLISMTVSVIAFVASVVAANAGSCYLAEQLLDPQVRGEYEKKIHAAKAAATSRYGASESYSVSFSPRAGEETVIDSFSYDCILCHDGMNAKYHDIRFRSSERREAMSLNSVLASHPIGMPYGAVAYVNERLNPLGSQHNDVVMVDGRVGCLSCHNLLNPGKSHLAVNNDYSALCLQCHKK